VCVCVCVCVCACVRAGQSGGGPAVQAACVSFALAHMHRDSSLREWVISLLDARGAWRCLCPAGAAVLLARAASAWALMTASKAQQSMAALIEVTCGDVLPGGTGGGTGACAAGGGGDSACDICAAGLAVAFKLDGSAVCVHGPAAIAARVLGAAAAAARRGSADVALPLGVSMPVSLCVASACAALRAWSAARVGPAAVLLARSCAALIGTCSDPAVSGVIAALLDTTPRMPDGDFGTLVFMSGLLAQRRCPDASFRAFCGWVCAPMLALRGALGDADLPPTTRGVIAAAPAFARAVHRADAPTSLRLLVAALLDSAMAHPAAAWYALHVVSVLVAAGDECIEPLSDETASSSSSSSRVLTSIRRLPDALATSEWLRASRASHDAVVSKLAQLAMALTPVAAPATDLATVVCRDSVACALADAAGAYPRDGDAGVRQSVSDALFACACRALD
jgi:hypothetical protein